MTWITAGLTGILFAIAVYLILEKHKIRLLFGFALLGHAANIFLLAMSGDPDGKAAPIVKSAGTAYVDPTPQALILTAIVIGFGVLVFLVALLERMYSHSRRLSLKEAQDDQ